VACAAENVNSTKIRKINLNFMAILPLLIMDEDIHNTKKHLAVASGEV
jgi:hypothetical protein